MAYKNFKYGAQTTSSSDSIDYPFLISWQTMQCLMAMNEINAGDKNFFAFKVEKAIQTIEALQDLLISKTYTDIKFKKSFIGLNNQYKTSIEKEKKYGIIKHDVAIKIKWQYYKALFRELMMCSYRKGLQGLETAYGVE